MEWLKTLKISEWKTVNYPLKTVGTASITKTKYRRGNLYLMEGRATITFLFG